MAAPVHYKAELYDNDREYMAKNLKYLVFNPFHKIFFYPDLEMKKDTCMNI